MRGRGQSEAYSLHRLQAGRSRKLVIAAAFLLITALTIILHVSSVDSVYVVKGKDAVGRLQKEFHGARPFSHLHNPFKQQARPPPIQTNSTWNEASWFSDWEWLNPFSSTVTLDEDRALLPPLDNRPPVYTYYEPRTNKAEASLKAIEDRLIGIWRRAWWAQGFKPIVLGPLEALENPVYQKLQGVKATPAMEKELMRWLAWSHMGDGILADWLAVPMAEYYQPTLVSLRAARYAQITRFADLELGLFSGSKKDVDSTINAFLDAQTKRGKPFNTLMDAINEIEDDNELFHVEARGKGVAFYSEEYVTKTWPAIGKMLSTERVQGLETIANMITGHLRTTFLAKYPNGIAIVAPHAINATLLPYRALTLATALNTCPNDPTAAPLRSCPPNRERCKPCQPVPLLFPSSAPNSTTTFTLGTVPHAYTFTSLLAPHDQSFNLTIPFIRRNTSRDPFIEAVTADIATKGISSYERIVKFKENVAQPGKGAMRSIWHTAESDWDWSAVEWHMGFELPKPAEADVSDAQGKPVPQKVIKAVEVGDAYPQSLTPLLDAMPAKPALQDLAAQAKIFKSTLDSLPKKSWAGKGEVDMRKISDSWHLADAEAWRFVRALQAREDLQRKKWLHEEGRFKH